jgi:RNA 2',3'-cyclic 3'-phosphodiesterase
MKRIFIAVRVKAEETLSGTISAFQKGLGRDSIKWTNQDNIHITLVFLGDTEPALIEPISAMLREKCEGTGKFDLRIKGSGVFKSIGDPRIIWMGIEPHKKLLLLNGLIVDGLKKMNFRIDERPFNPHLTIGRIKHLYDRDALKSLIDKYHDSVIQVVPVSEVILYESILLQTGPVYKSIAETPL